MGDKRTVDDLIESWDAADNQAGKPVSEEITDSDVSILSNAMAYALLGNSKRAVEMINKGSKTMSYGEALARMGIDDPSSTSATEMWKKISKPIAAAIKKAISGVAKSLREDVLEEGKAFSVTDSISDLIDELAKQAANTVKKAALYSENKGEPIIPEGDVAIGFNENGYIYADVIFCIDADKLYNPVVTQNTADKEFPLFMDNLERNVFKSPEWAVGQWGVAKYKGKAAASVRFKAKFTGMWQIGTAEFKG